MESCMQIYSKISFRRNRRFVSKQSDNIVPSNICNAKNEVEMN